MSWKIALEIWDASLINLNFNYHKFILLLIHFIQNKIKLMYLLFQLRTSIPCKNITF